MTYTGRQAAGEGQEGQMDGARVTSDYTYDVKRLELATPPTGRVVVSGDARRWDILDGERLIGAWVYAPETGAWSFDGEMEPSARAFLEVIGQLQAQLLAMTQRVEDWEGTPR